MLKQMLKLWGTRWICGARDGQQWIRYDYHGTVTSQSGVGSAPVLASILLKWAWPSSVHRDVYQSRWTPFTQATSMANTVYVQF